jgi:transcriptional regulator with XRE-family HTH domain
VSKRFTTKSSRLSRKLKQIRMALGLSQSEILDRLGLSETLFRSNISQYERGARVPSPKVLLQYSRLAEVNLAVLIDDDMDLPARFSPQSKVSRRK